jgi:4-hydroxy 2-oxovalerate aldolase
VTYSKENLVRLIERVNRMEIFAFFLVDTLGTLYSNDINQFFNLFDSLLRKEIFLGFHSHNNLQLSFSNAQYLIDLSKKFNRDIIIDSSVYGIGRGAGNLCTELLAKYLNDNFSKEYNIIPILDIVDQEIEPIKKKFTWGYSISHYLSSCLNCHPNYVSFLLNKQTVTINDIDKILKLIPLEKRILFDKELINSIYIEYLSQFIDDSKIVEKTRTLVKNKSVLFIAPGENSTIQINKILTFLEKNEPVIVSINFIPNDIRLRPNFVFVSNKRKFDLINKSDDNLTYLLTSNIIVEDICARVERINFYSYLNSVDSIQDNAGLMCLNFFLKNKIADNFFLAGFDGFETKSPSFHTLNQQRQNLLLRINKETTNYFNKLKKEKIGFHFITDSLYEQ